MTQRFFTIILSLLLMSCANTIVINDAPVPFIETEFALITSEMEKVRYTIRYKLSSDSPKILYGKIIYQDFINRRNFNTTLLGRLSLAKAINFNSMPSNQIVNKEVYSITLVLYEDADYNNIIGSHQDLTWFEMPENVATLLKLNLL